MVPRIFLKNATDEDRSFLRKWTYGVALAYGAFALALLLVGFSTTVSRNTLEANRAPVDNHASFDR
jgi:glucose uptake protein GlcU